MVDPKRVIQRYLSKIKKISEEPTNIVDLQPQIHWIKPDLQQEVGEYFENEATKEFLKGQDITFDSEEELLKIFSRGKPKEIDKSVLENNSQNLTLTEKDFEFEIQDSEYSISYQDMRKRLVKNKKITLPMPILLKIKDFYWGFAGNRRMNLAWSFGLPVTFFVVDLSNNK